MRHAENKLRCKQFFWAFSLIVLIIFCSVRLYDYRAFAVSSTDRDWSWTDGPAEVYSSVDTTYYASQRCNGVLQSVGVYPLTENKLVCINNSGTIRIGYYMDGGITRYVISYPLDAIFYQISLPCTYLNECLYVPGSDILVTKQNLINGLVKSLVIYKNVSKRIKITAESNLQFKYTFDLDNPDYIFRSTDGYAWPVGNFNASENGRWLAIELRERGVAILDLQTMVMKRLSAERLRYGLGMDPTTQLAISESGKQVVQMGANAGFSFYDLTVDCGVVADDETVWLDYVKNPCRKVAINFDDFISRFQTAEHPRFSNDGAELSFFTSSYSGVSKQVVLRAKNFKPQRVDYLAMGDSFTSGEGEFDDRYYLKGTNTEFEKCHVSSRSYPFQIAWLSNLDMEYVKSVACSGAQTQDVIGDGKIYLGQGGRLGSDGLGLGDSDVELAQEYARYNFLQGRIQQKKFSEQYQPNIITLGIGGNDVGLVDKLKACIGPDVCSFASDDKAKTQVMKEIRSKYSRLVETYNVINRSSPNSKIFVIGYPKVISETGNCGLVLNKLLDISERRFFNESILYLNNVIESAAKTVGVRYIENFDSFGEGVICGSNNEKAMNDFRIGDDIGLSNEYKWTRIIGAESFHPNPVGFKLIAENFVENIGTIDNAKVCQDGSNLCPVVTLPPEPTDYRVGGIKDELPILVSDDFVDINDVTSDLLTRTLKLESYSLQPNAVVEVFVYSDKKIIGEFMSDESGGFSQEIKLPADLDFGFHTIHLVGRSYSGESIELYQSISYYDDQPVVETQIEPKNTTTNQTTAVSEGKSGSSLNDVILSADNNKSTAKQDNLRSVSAAVKGASVNHDKDEQLKQAAGKNLVIYAAGIAVLILFTVGMAIKYKG